MTPLPPAPRSIQLLVALLLLGHFVPAPAQSVAPPIAAGRIQVTQANRATWQQVVFSPAFAAPPVVVMGPPSANDSAPAMTRVRNVTAAGFEFKIDEWNYLDGAHGQETVAYLAVPAGRHALGGFTLDARVLPAVTDAFQTVAFSPAFAAPPVVLAQAVTTANLAGTTSRALVARLSNVAAGSYAIRLQAEEAYRGTLVPEQVAVVAVSTGTGFGGPFRLQAGLTPATIAQNWTVVGFNTSFGSPVFLSHLQTFRTTKPITLRHRSLLSQSVELRVEAEQSFTKKTTITRETAGFLTLEPAVLDTDGDGLPDDWELTYGLNPSNPADAQQDPDGDGDPSLVEFRNNTNPVVFTEGQNGGTVDLALEVADAFEKDGTRARLRVQRTGATDPVLVAFTLGGNPSATGGSASPGDYQLRDAGGAVVSGVVKLPRGATSAVLEVEPVADSLNEVPEALTVSLSPGTLYQLGTATSQLAWIRDARNTAANQRLFVAYLGAQGSAITLASGLSTLRLNGDNTSTLVSLSFQGLTTPQTAVHIHLANPVSGPDVESLPLGQVTDHVWAMRATGVLTTDQEALDALVAGRLYINVHSVTYPTGEIRGDYRLQAGSTELQPPPPPPPIAPLAGADLDRDISRFLMQATFGPTPELINEVRQLVLDPAVGNGDRLAGMAAWLDRQMDPAQTPFPSLYSYVKAADDQEWALYLDPTATYYNPTFEPFQNNRRRGWWTVSLRAHAALRQRVAFALSQIFVVSDMDSEVGTRHYGLSDYYDMLARDAFGPYRTLLQDVTLHPIMGRYLSHLKNQKQVVDSQGRVVVSPDENYAREVMQLFSIGLVQLHLDGTIRLGQDALPIATYTQADIGAMARVLTGWSFSKRNNGTTAEVIDNTSFTLSNGSRYYQAQWMYPMKMFPTYHDTGAKVILGNVNIPAGQTGEQDLAMALDALAAHPNTAPFIVRRLIQRLVTSNPSRGYVYRVAQVFQQNGGNLGRVVKAILLDYEARSLDPLGNVGFGKQKEPLVRYLSLMRAAGGATLLPLSALTNYGYPAAELAKFPPGTSRYRYGTTDTDLSQTALRAPSVFNWFGPDYSPGGPLAAAGLVAPEFAQTSENQVVRAVNYHYQLSFTSTGQGVSSLPNQATANDDNIVLNLQPGQQIHDTAIAGGATAAAAVTQVLDYYDLLLTAGNLKARYASAPTPNPRSIIINTASLVSASTPLTRVRTVLYLLHCTPEFNIQK